MEFVRMVNTTARVYHLPSIRLRGERGREEIFDTIKLAPGGNNVPYRYAEALAQGDGRGSKLFAGLIETGDVVLDETPGATFKPEGPEAPRSLALMRPRAAHAMISTCADRDVLQRWESLERRKPVRDQIRARLYALGATQHTERSDLSGLTDALTNREDSTGSEEV